MGVLEVERLQDEPAWCGSRRVLGIAPADQEGHQAVGDRAHRHWHAVLDPLHEAPVELAAGAALGLQEARDGTVLYGA